MSLFTLSLRVQSTGPGSIKTGRCSWLLDKLNFICENRPRAGLESTWSGQSTVGFTYTQVLGHMCVEFAQYCTILHNIVYFSCLCVSVCWSLLHVILPFGTKMIQDTTNLYQFTISLTPGTNNGSRKVLSGISLHSTPSPSTSQDEMQALARAPGPDRSRCVETSNCYRVQIQMDNGDDFAGSLRFSDEATFHVNRKCITLISVCVH